MGATKTLSIGNRDGNFEEMLKERVFNIVLANEGIGKYFKEGKPTKEVKY